MLVNGEHRIGVYACTYTLDIILKEPKHSFISFFITAKNILEDEELFINYGPKFFPTDMQEEVEPKPTLSPVVIHDPASEHTSDSTYSEDSD